MRKPFFLLVLMSLLIICPANPGLAGTKGEKAMKITSTAFGQGEKIPPRYTCSGENVSPPISWKAVPEGTKSIAVITDDPDAPMGTWVHWVYYNIPAGTSGLPERIPQGKNPSSGGVQGVNDSGNLGYDGPCPPSGTHRYYFKAYALDAVLDLPPGSGKKKLVNAMKGHILGKGELMGTFKR